MLYWVPVVPVGAVGVGGSLGGRGGAGGHALVRLAVQLGDIIALAAEVLAPALYGGLCAA